MASNEERLGRPHVVQRIAEISDARRDGVPGALVTSTAAERIRAFKSYVQAVRQTPEPETFDDERLFEVYDGFVTDVHRYSQWGSEHNFAIMALACEWALDLKAEILRRMKRAS